MQRNNRELWLSFVAIAFITLTYLVVLILFKQIPEASDFYGHSLGILGFVLMLATETLYSLRKRSRSARWGRMSVWLQFHIFTGLVGPYLVLLHSAWKFNGLAGLVMLLTVVIVISGFVGRYIYTGVPRNVDGAEIEAEVLEREIQQANVELTRWLAGRPETIQMLARRLSIPPVVGSGGFALLFSRSLLDLGDRLRWAWERMKMDSAGRRQARHLEELLRRQMVLQRQLASLAMARRLLGLWHIIHIPIGLSLFVAAFIHIIAAVYYATLLR
jgi:hypothetical protein